MTRPDLTRLLGEIVVVRVDRPLGSRHPCYPDLVYSVNYGYLPGTVSGDGQPIDAYLLGVDMPVEDERGPVIAVIIRADDAEDKLVVAPGGRRFTVDEIAEAVAFQERFFRNHIVIPTEPS